MCAGLCRAALVPLVGGHQARAEPLQLAGSVGLVEGHGGQQADVHHGAGAVCAVEARVGVGDAIILI
jgi:hypothetical protein